MESSLLACRLNEGNKKFSRHTLALFCVNCLQVVLMCSGCYEAVSMVIVNLANVNIGILLKSEADEGG